MWEILAAIENSAFCTYVRDTPNVLGYSTVLAFHTFGMAFLVGLSGAVALRVLGFVPEIPLKPLERFFPLIIAGFWVNAGTGVLLTALQATSFFKNPDFWLKLVAIAFAIVSLRQLKSYAFDDPATAAAGMPPQRAKAWAGAMLAFWAVAVVAGRLLAYKNFVRYQTVAATLVAIALIVAGRFVIVRFISFMALGSPREDSPVKHAPAGTSAR